MFAELTAIHEAVQRVIARRGRGLLVTVVATRGSTYRRAGARCVIANDGEVIGAVSGGCVERDLALRARAWPDDFTPRRVTYDSSGPEDIVFGLGLGCRGEIEMLVEPFDADHQPTLPPIPEQRAVIIFGGGSDVEPVAALVRSMAWRADVVSSRTLPELTPYDAAVVMTHNFLRDVELLAALFASPIPYIGLLGPKSRGEELLTQLGEVTPEMRRRLHNPIGLDLGGDSPREIALAIVAEIQAVLNERDGVSLREKSGPIHEPRPATSPVTKGR